jgi:hypothetical protein
MNVLTNFVGGDHDIIVALPRIPDSSDIMPKSQYRVINYPKKQRKLKAGAVSSLDQTDVLSSNAVFDLFHTMFRAKRPLKKPFLASGSEITFYLNF